MDDIDDLIWQHNKEMAIESLQFDEVDSYTRREEITAKMVPHTSK